jgi:hypothetical protein
MSFIRFMSSCWNFAPAENEKGPREAALFAESASR